MPEGATIGSDRNAGHPPWRWWNRYHRHAWNHRDRDFLFVARFD